MPFMLTAPASFLCLPVESVFKYLKLIDFREIKLRETFVVDGKRHDQLSKKQYLLCQIADYLLNISDPKLKQIFYERLRHLDVFLRGERV
jgi:hypothetical protein